MNEHYYLLCSSLRSQLWNQGFIQVQFGWFLSSYTCLRIQTRSQHPRCFPHCALYWDLVHDGPRKGAGTYRTLQTSVPPCLDPWSWLQDCGWTATWRVSSCTHTTVHPFSTTVPITRVAGVLEPIPAHVSMHSKYIVCIVNKAFHCLFSPGCQWCSSEMLLS